MVGVLALFAGVLVCHASSSSEKTMQKNFRSENDQPISAKEFKPPQHLRLQPSSEQLPDQLPPSQQSLFQRLSGQQSQLRYPPPEQLHLQQFSSQQPLHQQQPPIRKLLARTINGTVTQTVPVADAEKVLPVTTEERTGHSQDHSGTNGSTRAAIIAATVVMVSTFVFVVVAVITQSGQVVVRTLRRVVLGNRTSTTPGIPQIHTTAAVPPRAWVRRDMAPEQTPPPPSQPTEQAPQSQESGFHSPEGASHSPMTAPTTEQVSQLPALASPVHQSLDVQAAMQTTQSADQAPQSQE